MAKVYRCPDHIQRPDLSAGWKKWKKLDKQYIDEVRAWCKEQNPKGQLVGEIFRYGVADGFAEYMVWSLQPLKLIHLEVGDAWHFQYIEKMNAKDIRQNIEGSRRLAMR
tara:strand:+ start:177 stop:503 length:327 start_codon:yes stop_codon:yes gene_type:complete